MVVGYLSSAEVSYSRSCAPAPRLRRACCTRARTPSQLHKLQLHPLKQNPTSCRYTSDQRDADLWKSRRETHPVPAQEWQPLGRACVVGAGAAGLVAALGLARFGMEVHVYDRNSIGDLKLGDSTQTVILSPCCLLNLQSLGFNVKGSKFHTSFLYSSEFRMMDSGSMQPRVTKLAGGQVYTTYEHLQEFLISEILRMYPDRVHLHPHHNLNGEDDVDMSTKTILFSTPTGQVCERYDMLVGADGHKSRVRRVLVKSDNRMASQLSFVAPLRYIGVQGLRPDAEWGSSEASSLAFPPLEGFKDHASIETSAQPVTLACPIEVHGYPMAAWGGDKYFKIKLSIHQCPASVDKYIGTLQGTPDLFTELDDALETGGKTKLLSTVETLFNKQLPQQWLTAVVAAIEANPIGHGRGANLVTNKLASPEKAPAIAVVGDAGHAVSGRTGYGLQAAMDTSISLVSCLQKATSIRDALEAFNAERSSEMTALSSLDRLAPAFFGEYAKMGPLSTIIQVAIAVRMWLSKSLHYLGLHQFAPFPSYLEAMSRGMSYSEVWKKLLRDTTIATGALCSAFFCLFRLAYWAYDNNRYMFV